MDILCSMNEKTGGRDKLARLVQYACRAIWDTLESSNSHKVDNKDLIAKLKNLEGILSQFRKVIHFGRALDSLYTVNGQIHYPDVVLATTLTLGRISGVILLFTDHVLFLHKLGFLNKIDTKLWGDLCNRSWLFSIAMGLVRDIYEIIELWKRNADPKQGLSVVVRSKQDNSVVAFDPINAIKVLLGNKPILLDTVKNTCDILIPLSSMGYVDLSPKAVGLLGVASSVVGIYVMVKPKYKLSPL